MIVFNQLPNFKDIDTTVYVCDIFKDNADELLETLDPKYVGVYRLHLNVKESQLKALKEWVQHIKDWLDKPENKNNVISASFTLTSDEKTISFSNVIPCTNFLNDENKVEFTASRAKQSPVGMPCGSLYNLEQITME